MLDEERLEKIRATTGIIGSSAAIRRVLTRIEQVAQAESTILITGDSGTGKELVARGIHALSARNGQAFVALNAGALPEALAEAELFGHEKGAFTGASHARKGHFELAHRGTLLLDEISETSRALQVKLLRVLEQQEVVRVGGQQPIGLDVRIIAATNQDLGGLVDQDRFRLDLYYRLKVLRIHLPPLRGRGEDIRSLTAHFVSALARRDEVSPPRISDEAMEALMDYSWPGNVRELRNLMDAVVVLFPGRTVGAGEVGSLLELNSSPPPESVAGVRSTPGVGRRSSREETSDHVLCAHSVSILDEEDWNRTRAASRLGVHRHTLRRRLNRWRRKGWVDG